MGNLKRSLLDLPSVPIQRGIKPRRHNVPIFLLLPIALMMGLYSPKSEARGVLMHVGPSFMLARLSHPGVSIGISGRIARNTPAYFGIDTGLYFGTSVFGLLFPLLGHLTYYFPTRDMIKPWLGFSFGPMAGFGEGVSGDFGMFMKGGGHMAITNKLSVFLELRVGFYGARLGLSPVLGGMFEL